MDAETVAYAAVTLRRERFLRWGTIVATAIALVATSITLLSLSHTAVHAAWGALGAGLGSLVTAGLGFFAGRAKADWFPSERKRQRRSDEDVTSDPWGKFK